MSATDPRPLPHQPPPMREVLLEGAQRWPERICAVFDDRTLSYGELLNRSRRVAAGLQAHGLAPGDPLLMVLGNRSEFLVSFLAAAHAGAIAVPVNVALKGESLAHVLGVTAARLAVIEAGLLARVRDALPAGTEIERIFVVGEPGGDPGARSRPYAPLEATQAPLAPVAIGRGDPCTVLFTSGTTGLAKGVIMPHQQFASAAWDAAHDLAMDAHSVFYTFSPLFHLNALVYGPMAAIMAGGRAVVRYAFPREQSLADLRRSGATHWTIPPFVVRGLLAAPERPDDADNDLRYLLTFGLNQSEVEAFARRFGCTIVSGYGCTEAGMMCRLQSRRPTTAGRPSDRFDMRIVDAAGRDVPTGEVGEIWVRARQPFDRMLGYYRMPAETEAAFSGEWFRTGDLGRFDPDGYLHFADRLKDSIKRRGSNISSFEVERVLLGFPGVVNAAVVGYRPAPEAEEEVRAFVEIGPDTDLGTFDYAGLIRRCSDNLAYFMVPRYVDVVRELPRTALGKVQKPRLRELPLSGTTFDVRAAGIEVER